MIPTHRDMKKFLQYLADAQWRPGQTDIRPVKVVGSFDSEKNRWEFTGAIDNIIIAKLLVDGEQHGHADA